jgi:UDP-N-acetylmuramyl tripeptide synthase
LDARLGSAVLAGNLAGFLSRRLGAGGGTTLPGELATRLDPQVLPKLSARLARGSIVVTGTNGKTTTSRLISSVLSEAAWRPVHNRAGANLLSGVTSALISQSSLRSRLVADVGLFEVDEAVMPEAVARTHPRVVVVTNLFRDQLDRYGEVDYLAGVWRKALSSLPPDATVVLNADDPLVASLGAGLAARVVYFGVDDESVGALALEHAADSKVCLACGTPYDYSVAYYGHVGKYRCPNCGQGRPEPSVVACSVSLAGVDGASLVVGTPQGDVNLSLRLPGLYNVYNALAATAGCLSMGVELDAVKAGVDSFVAAFGRIERVRVEDKTAFLALVKNPVGFNQVIRTVFGPEGVVPAEPRNALILINDHFADGTDISWLWDVDFELLRGRVGFVVVGGTRAEDMAVRLKYAGVDAAAVTVEGSAEAALTRGLERTTAGGTLYVLPTYTAMLEVRGILSRWRYVEEFWEN